MNDDDWRYLSWKQGNDDMIKLYYYKIGPLDYTVKYYYDGVIDEEETTNQSAECNSVIYEEDIVDKNRYGYKLDRIDNVPLEIDVNSPREINVYYVTDESQTKELKYTVEYYKDGEKVTSDTQTEKIEVQVLEPNTITVDKTKINTQDKYEGYKLDENSTGTIPDTVDDGDVIKVYYITDESQTKELKYTVEYYKDGEKVTSDTQIETIEVQVLKPDIISVDKTKINITDKYEGYKLDKISTGTIPDTVNNGDIIKVYYVIDESQTKELKYIVEYYKNGKKVKEDTQEEKIKVHILNGDTISVNILKINLEFKHS